MPTLIDTIEAAAARGAAARPTIGGFPYVAESLRAAGVTKYLFDVPSTTVIYVTDDGAVLRPGQSIRTGATVVPAFDPDRLVAAIRIDQRGESTFPEFVKQTFLAGVVRYVVDTAARTCTYIGGNGESYVEEYPAVVLPPDVAPTPSHPTPERPRHD